MPKFRFVVRSSQGKTRRGTVTDTTAKEARARLQSAGFQVISLMEMAELVVHEAPQVKSGRRPEKVEIIEFESNLLERLWEGFEANVLRKEVAAVLLVLGTIAMGIGLIRAPKEEPPRELKYVVYHIQVEVDRSGVAGDEIQVFLPDLPFKTVVDVSDSGTQTVEFVIEAATQPINVEVALFETGVSEPVATSKGSLTAQSGEEGALASKQLLIPTKR